MSGNDQSGYRDLRPDQQGSTDDSERIRQARQAERGAPQADQHGGLEPRDSRNVTGMQGGTGQPGGAFQQEGSARWGGDAQQGQQAAARQPDATTAAGQQPGIDRREMQAEQQAQQPRQAGHLKPEGQHMADAHVPPQHLPQMGQSMGSHAMHQSSGHQSMGGMGQSFSAE